jgi:DNA polymerase III delta subunit
MTKDAEKFLYISYQDYLDRIKSGSSKTQAKSFSKDYRNENGYFSSWHEDDFSSVCSELKKLGFLKVYVSGSFELTPNAIEYLENRFKNNLKELADIISKFIP